MNVCAVLVNYYCADDIHQVVLSLLADAPGIEIVVVDNSDDSREWARLNDALPHPVRKIRAQGNIGFGQGCNLAIESTDAAFIFLVNPDVEILAQCTKRLYSAMLANPKLAAASPRQFLDEACEWILPPSWLPTAIRSWVTERALREPLVASRLARASYAELQRFWNATEPIRQRALSGGALMLRRSALLAEDFVFDPKYFMYFEDTDLCLRLRRQNFDLSVIPDARAIHSWKNQPHKSVLMTESARLYFEKFYGSDNSWLSKANFTSHKNIHIDHKFSQFPEHGLALSEEWMDGWTFELSPSPLIQPAIAMIGTGSRIAEPKRALSHFESSSVYGRLKKANLSWNTNDIQYFIWSAQRN